MGLLEERGADAVHRRRDGAVDGELAVALVDGGDLDVL